MNRILFLVLALGLIGCGDDGPKYKNLVGDSWVIDTDRIQADLVIVDNGNFEPGSYKVAAGSFSLEETGGTVHEFDVFQGDITILDGHALTDFVISDSTDPDNYIELTDITVNKAFTVITAQAHACNISGVESFEGLALSLRRK